MENEKLIDLIDRAKVYERACVGCTRHGELQGECYQDEPCEKLIFAFTVAESVNAVVLPCKVGDILYTFCIKGIDDYFIRESVVSRIEISEDFGIKIIERRKDPSGAYFYFQIDIDEIGQSIFLTKEEALKKMGR